MWNPISRRRILTGAAAGAALAGTPFLSSCNAGDADSGEVGGRQATIEFPVYQPFDKIKTDYPATEAGGLAAFLGVEKPAPDAITEVPGTGGPVSVVFETEIATPPPLESNAHWQNLNKSLGVDLRMQAIPSDQYDAKIATILAGGDLPDVMSLPTSGLAQMPKLLESQFTDLSEYLAGDAVLDYPMLAARPESMWWPMVFNNGIYGVPTPNARVSPNLVARQDILEERGLNGEVGSAEEFTELCVALTDAKNDRFAAGRPAALFNFVGEMFQVPNEWRVEDGAFTSQYATDEFKQALDYTAGLWKKGVFRPDSFYSGTQTMIDHWGVGNTALFVWGGTGWKNPLNQYGSRNPKMDLAFIHPPRADGSGPARKHLGSGVYRMGVIRKGASPERVRELLRIQNYIAASFGTAEYFDVEYGVEGKDWNWQEADGGLWLPERTDRGRRERSMVFYISGALFVLSTPGHPDVAKRAYEYYKEAAENGEPLPTAGLYSETQNTDGTKWAKDMNTLIAEIIQGRKSLADWDDLVKRWKSDVGDAIAEEYAEAAVNV